ncbi:MAG: DUF58 domain-containing protein [Endozoicomonas sp.]
MISSVRTRLRQSFRRWLDNRIPSAPRVTLDQRRIFIMPTRPGYAWLFLALIVFLLAVNYRNSLAFGLSFFMISLFMLSILHTWRNLAGLTLVAREAEQGHAGQNLHITLELKAGVRPRRVVSLGWPDHETVIVSFNRNREQELLVRPEQRGWLSPGRLKVESIYPLGLCRTWSWVALDVKALVYPRPDFSSPLPSATGGGEETMASSAAGHDDFAGFKRHQDTDLPTHVDWKGYARSGEMNTKVFESPVGDEVILKLADTPGQNLEEKLSVLTGWCLVCERNRQPYGFVIPGTDLAPALGTQHLEKCLEALALFDLHDLKAGGNA